MRCRQRSRRSRRGPESRARNDHTIALYNVEVIEAVHGLTYMRARVAEPDIKAVREKLRRVRTKQVAAGVRPVDERQASMSSGRAKRISLELLRVGA